MQTWRPNSWQHKTYFQEVAYPCPKHLQRCLSTLNNAPSIINPGNIDEVKQLLALASQGKAFVLQGGDCVEMFSNCQESYITQQLKCLVQAATIFSANLNKPMVTIGRIAGQYAKPRSKTHELVNNQTLLSYRGDLINENVASVAGRTPNPERLLQGYQHAQKTLKIINNICQQKLKHFLSTSQWDINQPELNRKVIHIKNSSHPNIINNTIYTSHEALHLPYEQALTRYHNKTKQWYNVSTHLPWLGMRTAHLEGAHVEYLRGIANPIAIKVGSNCAVKELITIIKRLNPTNEAGKITLITRLGKDTILKKLPILIQAINSQQLQVLWSCDPMHGNTLYTLSGIKTRRVEDIIDEINISFRIHQENTSVLGGVHLELSGDHITECIGGLNHITEEQLAMSYYSCIDPRLSYMQTLEVASKTGLF